MNQWINWIEPLEVIRVRRGNRDDLDTIFDFVCCGYLSVMLWNGGMVWTLIGCYFFSFIEEM